jgi:hypothetical protein
MVVQEVPFDPTKEVPIFGGATYWNNFVYFGARNFPLKAFSLTDGVMSSSPVDRQNDVYAPRTGRRVSDYRLEPRIHHGVFQRKGSVEAASP